MVDPLNEDIRLQVLRSEAINSYAVVEQSLCRIFAIVLNTDRELAAIVFYSITNTHSRNRIFDELLAKRYGTTYDVYWNGIPGAPNRKNTSMFRILSQLDQSRNEIVHWHMSFKPAAGYLEGLAKPRVWRALPDDARMITADELREFCYKAAFISQSLSVFSMLLEGELRPEGEWQPWLDIFQQPALYPPPDSHPLSPSYKAPGTPPQPSGA